MNASADRSAPEMTRDAGLSRSPMRVEQRRALRLLLAALLWTAGACKPHAPPAGDLSALAQVQEQFGHKFQFRLEDELYLRARMRYGTSVAQNEVEAVYRAFFFDADGQRRETTYVYLNIYNPKGRFIRQLAYDPTRRRIMYGETEHYR